MPPPACAKLGQFGIVPSAAEIPAVQDVATSDIPGLEVVSRSHPSEDDGSGAEDVE